jgi:hypothetical protein
MVYGFEIFVESNILGPRTADHGPLPFNLVQVVSGQSSVVFCSHTFRKYQQSFRDFIDLQTDVLSCLLYI